MEREELLKLDLSSLEIYSTNSALGYNQSAILLKLLEDEESYLVIDTIGIKENESTGYKIGAVVFNEYKDLVKEKIDYKIEQSPLFDSFLFRNFLKYHFF